MTTAASPPRPIPTVPAGPALLRKGDMIHPEPQADLVPDREGPFRVIGRHRVTTSTGTRGWWIDLDGHLVYLIRDGVKVRTQRRPNHTPPIAPEAADQIADSYREARYG